MSLFQKSVEKKYLNDLDTVLIDKKYADFQNYFGDSEIQENIRNSKEEQFQEGFLRELFVSILEYTLNPHPNFNLTTELKNITNSKKADGAILKGDDATAVIELKGTDTTDLDKIETQAFGYKNHHPKCKYVITSNFEKLRFYIQNAVDHVDFDLFNLSKEQFSLLWLCLAKDNLLADLPLKIKESSVLQEENITKKLYADYSKFREAIYSNLVKNNPETDKLLLFKKTQKLLDRFLFIFFAEDRLLVPANSISQIIEKWKDDVDFGDAKPLYYTFKKYFHVLNVGRPKSGNRQEIFAYNGGLFQPDEILDNITIDDDILHKHTLRLSNYDFETDVDVNILGHIFEHSLAAMEQAPLSATPTPSIRKRDGIFYTPKYITKYIVENTVGKLCEEKRTELGIVDEDYAKGRKNRKKEIVKSLDKKLDDYRNYLLSLTILDPACGSGAFLNQALEFLINEHHKIDALRGQLLGGAIIFSDITTDILEKNIYGVDLNEESVEIAKLSLWLRTAQKGRKLNTLSNNIKCGNSLIDDPEVAGYKAFNWQSEFPNIFQKKNKKAWHVTTATHNSRYSQRMFDNYVKLGEPVWLSEKEEIIVSETIAEIAEKDKLNILAYNICGDHAHILLVCEEEELAKIVQKIKSMSARACNIAMGRTIPSVTAEHAPQYLADTSGTTPEQAPVYSAETPSPSGEHAPLRGKTQFHLWAAKFDQKEISSEEQLQNTIAYIRNNRTKHGLDTNKGACSLVVCTREHAFRTEYKGGFDVVIGNPPYGAKLDKKTQDYLNNKYIKGGAETAISFIKLSYTDLLKDKGSFGFIIPKSFSFASNYQAIREFILDDINKIIDCKKVWKEVKLEQIMFFFSKKVISRNYISGILKDNHILELGIIEKETFNEFGFYLNGISEQELKIAKNINKSKFFIKDIATNSRGGIFQKHITDNGDTKVLGGAEIQREGIKGVKGYIDKSIVESDEKCLINSNSVLTQNIVAHIENPVDHIKITACIPEKRDFVIVDTINQITFNEKYNAKVFWLLFNSKLINWYAYRFIIAKAIRTIHFDSPITNRIPVPLNIEQQPFIVKADQMLSYNKELQEKATRFINRLESNLEIEKISTKLEKFFNYDFKTFVAELKKQKVNLSLTKQDEWEEYFNSYKSEINQLQIEIEKTDKEIDQMVYELYGLTEEEIKIVEGKE